jgi:ribosomal subunit interface protein
MLMTIQITGKNIDAGDAFQSYASDKISAVVKKYVGKDIDGHVRLEKERGLFKTTCLVRLASGLMLEAHGEGDDAYASTDAAAQRLETRVRRYKERIKSHSGTAAASRRKASIDARDFVVSVDEEDNEHDHNKNPLIIAENQRSINEWSVREAVMQLDLSEAAFMIFKNAAHGGLNIVYRRSDGNIGWIDAEPQVNGKADGKSA